MIKEIYKSYEEISSKKMRQLVSGAKRRNLSFKITAEEIWNVYLNQDKKCALTGWSISFLNKICDWLEPSFNPPKLNPPNSLNAINRPANVTDFLARFIVLNLSKNSAKVIVRFDPDG